MAACPKKRVVIIGAGLAGSIIASQLFDDHEIIVIEALQKSSPSYPNINDVGYPSNSEFLYGFGPGGSTAYWHNGLIEPPRSVTEKYFPIWGDLESYIQDAHIMLSGVDIEKVRGYGRKLTSCLVGRGFQEKNLGSPLYYPAKRINAWYHFVGEKINPIIGDAIEFVGAGAGSIESVLVQTKRGLESVKGDIFVLSAGGIMSPLILSQSSLGSKINVPLIGEKYEDHPMGFIGEVELTADISSLWNHHLEKSLGFLRIPVVINADSLQVALYMRPAIESRLSSRRKSFRSTLSNLRNNPSSIQKILGLMGSADDMIELAAIKFGLYFPSKRFSLLIVAEQSPDSKISGSYKSGRWTAERDWKISKEYLDKLEGVITKNICRVGPFKSFEFYPGWRDDLMSSSHHSGTCRAGTDSRNSVCDGQGRIWGVENLFVCDGSIIPTSGYCNTGLLIGALALRLAGTIRNYL